MCFGPLASFAAATLLLPVGVHCIRVSGTAGAGYGAIAAFPLLFGVQQVFEGLLWLSLGGDARIDPYVTALGYLFFAHFLWPVLVPFAAWRIERERRRRRVFVAMTVLALPFGALLYLPSLAGSDWLRIETLYGSILYEPVLMFDPIVPRAAVRTLYALLVTGPLLLCTDRIVRTFGALVLVSALASAIVYEYAFVSVWCFFAALLSLHLIGLLRVTARREGTSACQPTTPRPVASG